MRLKLLILCSALLAAPALVASRTSISGMILSIDPQHRTASISCRSVPGSTEAKIISVLLKGDEDLSRLHAGTMVEFTLVAERDTYQAESIHVQSFQSVEQDPFTAHQLHELQGVVSRTPRVPTVSIGEVVPDFRLIDQNKQSVRLSQFTGKVIAINFAYTRCALPQFCYRLTNNLANLQKRFSGQMARNLVLLTISFDPIHDNPGVLADAASMWKADSKGWRFLTGEPEEIRRVCKRFGVDAWQDEGLMIHSLHTVVIDRRQKLVTNLEGNEFTAQQLGDLVEVVMRRADQPK